MMITTIILLMVIEIESIHTISHYKLNGASKKFEDFTSFILDRQQNILSTLEQEEKKENSNALFERDYWEKNDKNGISSFGLTACLQDGKLLEKAAASTTIVKGQLSKERSDAISSRDSKMIGIEVGNKYYASALSLVLHSRSPLLPTFRSDVRYFEVEKSNGDRIGWFGGGADLTPYYLCDNEIKHFHNQYKQICDKYDDSLYDSLKKNCDNYFYIPARQEHRGVGGIFFDDLSELPNNGNAMEFTKSVCDMFMKSYLPLIPLNSKKYTEEQRNFQLLRRGRYIGIIIITVTVTITITIIIITYYYYHRIQFIV
jgi:coproporphyrinogen III oxidase